MKGWQAIRVNRPDLTDYIVHFTKSRAGRVDAQFASVRPRDVLLEILEAGYVRATFAPLSNRYSRTPRATVKGPHPAVCLTEQPLWAFLKYRTAVSLARYSGYGIAYHKYLLYNGGGRPVLYGTDEEIGRRLREGEEGWEAGKDVFTGGLPRELQYLWVNYRSDLPENCDYPIDFTWEREWRVRLRRGQPGLPVHLDHAHPGLVAGAVLVERDVDVGLVRERLASLAERGMAWAGRLTRVISLETTKRRADAGEAGEAGEAGGYVQVDTWKDD